MIKWKVVFRGRNVKQVEHFVSTLEEARKRASWINAKGDHWYRLYQSATIYSVETTEIEKVVHNET